MSKHNKFSPSNSNIWVNCAGSVNFTENLNLVKVDDKNTIDGTRAHFLLSEAIRTNVNPKHLLSGVKYKDKHGEWQADQNMIDAGGYAYEYILQRSHEMSVAPLCDENVDPSTLVGGVHGEMDGSCDVYIKAPNYLEVIEFKYGMLEIQALDNSQLELYAAGIMAKYAGYQPANIQLTVIQPCIQVLGQDPIKIQVTTLELLHERWTLIKKALFLANTEIPTLSAGSWCKHCLALGRCSANTEQSLKVLGYDPLSVVEQSMKHVDATTLPDEQLVEIYLASKQIKQTLIACEVELTKRTHDKSIKGVKLVRGNGSKSWNMCEAETTQQLYDVGIPVHTLHKSKFVSPAQALKLSWKHENITSGINKKQKDKLMQLMTINQGQPTLALENDSRKAIGADTEKMFVGTKVDRVLPKEWSL